jgi:hypothetical protein
VKLDGMVVGTTPYSHTDTDVAGTIKHYELELPGYQPALVSTTRMDWSNPRTVAFIAGGICFTPVLAGLLWAPDYTPIPEVQLEPLSNVPPGTPLQGPPPTMPPPPVLVPPPPPVPPAPPPS